MGNEADPEFAPIAERIHANVGRQGFMNLVGAELRRGLDVGSARVGIADRRGEEFKEVLAGFLAGIGDNPRHGNSPGRGGQERGGDEKTRQWLDSGAPPFAARFIFISSRLSVSVANALRFRFPTSLSISSASTTGIGTLRFLVIAAPACG